MQKVFVFLLMLLVLSSCGKRRDRLYIDPELKPYTDAFLAAGKIRGQPIEFKNIVIMLDDLAKYSPDTSRIGGCFYNRSSEGFSGMDDYDDANIVIIDSKFFHDARANDYNKRDLISHELGHCVLGRKHDPRITRGLPESIMNPYLISLTIGPDFYLPMEHFYFDELFKIIDSAVQPGMAYGPNGLSSSQAQKISEQAIGKKMTFFSSSDGSCVTSDDSK